VLLRFFLAFLLFTFGPGAFFGLWITQSLDTPRRIVVLLGIGTAATAVLIDILGRLGWLGAFPYVAIAMTAISIAAWRRGAVSPQAVSEPLERAAAWRLPDFTACALILSLAAATSYVVFAHRVSEDASQIALRGDYDSLDLSYYAAVSAEATHTVPPTASYYAGRELNYAYYPQLVLAMVHRYAGVPMLAVYFRYGWPAFLAIAGLSMYLFVRAIAPPATAVLAVVLLMIAGDFSYVAAWHLPHTGFNWDYVLWPTNFLSPTMEPLFFNSWTPSLPIMFTALWGIAHGLQARTAVSASHKWTVMSAFLLGVLFQFKPFAFIVLSAALVASVVFAGGDREARRRFAITLVLSGIFALPFVYRSVRLYADRRSELRIAWFLLPQRMLIKLDLLDAFSRWAGRVAPAPWMAKPLMLCAATGLFLAGGLGIRWLGVPGVWRALRGSALRGSDPMAKGVTGSDPVWRLLAWTTVAGIAIPFVLVTEPYNDTLQFYQVGLYIAWIFTAAALTRFAARRPVAGIAAIAVAIALSLPSSVHYLQRRWTDATRPPLVSLTRAEIDIVEHLRSQDPEKTVVLNDRPLDPSLLAVLSERRIVLAWGRYAVGSAERLREVEAFYSGSRAVPDLLDILRKHHVTHVVVHAARDRVPPEVLARLTLVMGDGGVGLYEVPETLR
jgi:hypothetical protein